MGVTIGELVEDFIPHTEKGNKITQVEIVPRQIVEDILKVCDVQSKAHEDQENRAQANNNQLLAEYHLGCVHSYQTIKGIVEIYLQDFENGGMSK